MPTSMVASNSSVAISVNCLQPRVQCCSDCGSVNKFHTSCEEAGNMKRPSIFIYQFHRHCIIEAQSLRSPSGISPFPPAHCSVLRFGNPGVLAPLDRTLANGSRSRRLDMPNVSCCQMSFGNIATMTFGYQNPSVVRQL